MPIRLVAAHDKSNKPRAHLARFAILIVQLMAANWQGVNKSDSVILGIHIRSVMKQIHWQNP